MGDMIKSAKNLEKGDTFASSDGRGNETVLPMKSARIAAGEYEVLGTSTACVVQRENDPDEPVFWTLISNGLYVKAFPTKREALQYCQEHPEL